MVGASDTGTGTGGLDRCPFSQISAAGDRESEKGRLDGALDAAAIGVPSCAEIYEYRKFDHVPAHRELLENGHIKNLSEIWHATCP